MSKALDNVAPDTRAAAEALARLATMGRGQQYVWHTEDEQRQASAANAGPAADSSIFSTGRLRGAMHYEASLLTLPEDNLAKFIDAISRDAGRAALVRSVKFDAICDDVNRSGLIDLFNETLPAYAFTQDASGGPFPPVTEVALLFKKYQTELAALPEFYWVLGPRDLTVLDRQFLTLAFIGEYILELYIHLFIKLCPNLEIIEIPSNWWPLPDLPFSESRLNEWKQQHQWDVEVKEIGQGYVWIGRKPGWTSDQCHHWMNIIAEDIANFG